MKTCFLQPFVWQLWFIINFIGIQKIIQTASESHGSLSSSSKNLNILVLWELIVLLGNNNEVMFSFSGLSCLELWGRREGGIEGTQGRDWKSWSGSRVDPSKDSSIFIFSTSPRVAKISLWSYIPKIIVENKTLSVPGS